MQTIMQTMMQPAPANNSWDCYRNTHRNGNRSLHGFKVRAPASQPPRSHTLLPHTPYSCAPVEKVVEVRTIPSSNTPQMACGASATAKR